MFVQAKVCHSGDVSSHKNDINTDNKIQDKGAIALAEALKINIAIEEIFLCGESQSQKLYNMIYHQQSEIEHS